MTTAATINIFARLRWVAVFIVVGSCVDRIEFNTPPARTLMVVDGLISTDPGPYTVTITNGFDVDEDSILYTPVQRLAVTLHEVNGVNESFIESSPGVYRTKGVIQGQTGHSYYINIKTIEGKIFESQPEMINPVGKIGEIRFEFEKRIIRKNFYETDNDVFNVFLDSDAGGGSEVYVRWRFKGTYLVVTYPQFFFRSTPPYTPYKDPFPCSGYVLGEGPEGSGGVLRQVGQCTCCTCWANNFETIPQIADASLVAGNQFKNVKIAEVSINNRTFYDKYLVEIEQMSLTKNAFDFFKLVRKQKEEASSLFQPPAAEIRGNVKALNNNDLVIGLFWATSIATQHVFIEKSDIPFPLPEANLNTLPCTTVPFSSTTKPKLWR
jgi:hypothetical protein